MAGETATAADGTHPTECILFVEVSVNKIIL